MSHNNPNSELVLPFHFVIELFVFRRIYNVFHTLFLSRHGELSEAGREVCDDIRVRILPRILWRTTGHYHTYCLVLALHV